MRKIPIIEYIYIVEFALQLYLWIGISENNFYRSYLTLLSGDITIVLVVNIIIYIKNFLKS